MRSNGGIADVADIRSWAPLPETAYELCDVVQDFGVDPKTHLYLGAMATETKIKQLSRCGSATSGARNPLPDMRHARIGTARLICVQATLGASPLPLEIG
jgi:hypothetical protein